MVKLVEKEFFQQSQIKDHLYYLEQIFLGGQRYAATWTGDNKSSLGSFKTFHSNVPIIKFIWATI